MTGRVSMTRRRLLTALATVAGLFAVGLVRLRPWSSRQDGRAVWLSLVGDRRSSRAVGQAYLASLGTVPGPSALRRQLLPADPERAAWLLRDVGRLRRHIQQQVRDDFESGRTVQVHGWVLAETEARVCALIAML